MFFSLRNRLFLIFTFLLTIPFVVLSIIIPNWLTSMIEEQTQELTVEMMDQYSLYIDSITTQAEDLGKQVLLNQSTQQWLKTEKDGDETSQEELFLMKNQVQTMLSSVMINNSNSMSISIFLNDGTGTWGDNPNLQETDWYINFTENQQNFTRSHVDPYQQSEGIQKSQVNSYILPLFDMNTIAVSGIIKVNFPSSLLKDALSKNAAGQSGRTYIINEQAQNVLDGQIQTPLDVLNKSVRQINNNGNEKGLIETDFDGDTYFVFYQKLPIGNWILMNEVTESNLFAQVHDLQRTLFLSSAAIFILTILASFFLSSNIVNPLGKLAKAMKFIERGDFAGAKRFMPSIKSKNHEVGYLVNVVDHTIDQLKNVIETEYEANIRRKDAEYKALLLQINPHFMNNTLEIIGGLAAQGKNKEVVNVSVYLGRMMRYSLNTHSSEVRLKEELSYIHSYTDILKLRYEDSLTVEIIEDPEASDLSIIKFILQPLVENAVQYSFSEKNSAEVSIRTTKRLNQVLIEVEDKGAGMSEKMVNHLLSFTNNVLESKGESIGLKNVLGRLTLYYGENFSYQIDSQLNQGTKITLCINVSKGEGHAERNDYR
ncbi:sensor histidine kinase [Jeotgalibacillus sp. S-D1]|uniref:sensor histidine kinase n=1 Tax=Jeotgalibacillus sp. S-D1 TaxID=2552189 RepID=UPI0010596EDC|nr:sensor histidine kinase [Jeotgalibacillus sp. S-D1]TDL34206.1 sensor histidine kinase [Jeotgalibacillus sp. S-D1]